MKVSWPARVLVGAGMLAAAGLLLACLPHANAQTVSNSQTAATAPSATAAETTSTTSITGAAVPAGAAASGNDEAGNDDLIAEDQRRWDEATFTDEMLADAVRTLDQGTFTLDAATTRSWEQSQTGDPDTVVTLAVDLIFDGGETASTTITSTAKTRIEDLADEIPQDAEVTVDGHTDSRGGDAVNDPLSQQRADAVATVLREKRPDLDITAQGHGSSEPVADNTVDGADNPTGRALNRRVVVTYPTP